MFGLFDLTYHFLAKVCKSYKNKLSYIFIRFVKIGFLNSKDCNFYKFGFGRDLNLMKI